MSWGLFALLVLGAGVGAGAQEGPYPRILGEVPLEGGGVHPTVTSAVHDGGSRMYVYVLGDEYKQYVEVFDTTRPSEPTLVRSVPGPQCGCSACGGQMVLQNGMLFGIGCQGYVWSMNTTTFKMGATSPPLGVTMAMSADANRLYVAGDKNVTVLLSSDLSVLWTRRVAADVESVLADGGKVYVSADQLLTLDSRDGTVRSRTPVQLSFMGLEGGVLYGVSDSGVVRTLNVSDRSVPPEPLGSVSVPVGRFSHGMQVSQGTLYVAAGYSGVQVVDAADPSTPKLGDPLVVTPEKSQDVWVFLMRGGYGYVGTFLGGFYSALMRTDPTPSPPPPVCTVCGMESKACCNPAASPAQLCPGGARCCNCGGPSCACS